MAPTIIDSDAVQGETCLPGQISVFGGFALQANSLGPQCEATKDEDLSGEEGLTLDCIAIDDRRSHQA